jgi:methylmalonyl-CoA mutase cobalamin-binding domain/chain
MSSDPRPDHNGEEVSLAHGALVKRAAGERRDWEKDELHAFVDRRPEQRDEYHTRSGIPVERVYTPSDVAHIAWADVGLPGRPPYTRGPYPTMYRGRTWTMRQIAGFGTPQDTNERFRFLIDQGQTGLSVDFDMPTLMGFDSDHEMSFGEVGREGVAVDVLPDMEALFDGIDLESISVSMTINPTAWILLAMYVAVAEDRGLDLTRLSGTIQNDILKEYIAQKEWIYPARPSMRIVRDTVAYCAERLPRYNPINISGYHISEAGATAVQEAAFTMANTREYVREFVRTGMEVDEFAPRLSFFFVAQNDFFEEIAKFRALRRCYARMMESEFKAQRPESKRLRFHTQTAAATLTKPQPQNNIVRTALQALAAVLGGTQSLHTNGLDEAYAIPSEEAMKIALRTQQIIADETNIPQVIDPLGGSYYVEALTDRFEQSMQEILDRVEDMGGSIAAIDEGYFQREIAESAWQHEQEKAAGERVVIGVNRYVEEDERSIEVHKVNPESESRQIEHLQATRAARDEKRFERAMSELREAAADESTNIMPPTIEAVREHASMGEIVEALRERFGSYQERPVF